MAAGRGNTLIVDDESDMRLLLVLTINGENRGLRVVGEAASGEDALRVRPELDIDVIVIDHRMPGLTGIETAAALLADEPDLPIVLYSAYLDDVLVEEAREIGVRHCVKKGDVPALIATLRELTGLNLDEAPRT